jgi:prevent-host-death family protein
MKKIGAAQFKAQCLALLDQVDPDGLLITKHGKPVARLLPAAAESGTLVGCLKGRIKVTGDLQSTGVPWRAGA